LKYGYDAKNGGFYGQWPVRSTGRSYGQGLGPRHEAIVSALYTHRLTGEQRYFTVYQQTLDLIEKRLVDWENGEWHATLQPDGLGQWRQGATVEGRATTMAAP
jgi:mannose/cellobiose epimerase-like protein (N-acyl-D-glucosamine 2-epimerase family)